MACYLIHSTLRRPCKIIFQNFTNLHNLILFIKLRKTGVLRRLFFADQRAVLPECQPIQLILK